MCIMNDNLRKRAYTWLLVILQTKITSWVFLWCVYQIRYMMFSVHQRVRRPNSPINAFKKRYALS